MLKITKASTVVLIFYVLFYVQIWGDNHLILYGSAAVSVISMLIYCMRTGSLAYDRVPYGIWNNLIMVIYTIVTGLFVSVDFQVSFRSSITLFAFAAICIALCYASAEEGSFEWMLKALIALALLCSVYTITCGTSWSGYGVSMSATNNPHTLGAVLNLGVFSIAYLVRDKKKKLSLINATLIFLFTVVTIMCGSRKFLIANVLIEGIWAWAVVREEWKTGDTNRKIIIAFLIIIIACVAYYIIHTVYLNSDSYNRMQNTNDMGNQHRIMFYEESWKIFLDHPIFGGGLNQFSRRSTVATGNYAHSTYAEAIADFGFVGCVLYFTPIITVTYRIIKKALGSKRNYGDYLLLAFCLSELFIGTGQIFFLEFNHFIAWSIVFFYGQPDRNPMLTGPVQQAAKRGKYLRYGQLAMDSMQRNTPAREMDRTGKYFR